MIAKYCPEYSLNKKSTLVAITGSGNVAQVSNRSCSSLTCKIHT